MILVQAGTTSLGGKAVMLVIAFGLFLLLPLVLLLASLGRTAVGMARGADAAPAPQPQVDAASSAPALTLVETPATDTAPAERKRFPRRQRGDRHDFFGDAVAPATTMSRRRDQDHAPAAPVADTAPVAPAAPRPVVIPAPAPVFARTVEAPAVARPIAPAGAEAKLVLR